MQTLVEGRLVILPHQARFVKVLPFPVIVAGRAKQSKAAKYMDH